MDIEERAERWARDNYGPGKIGRYIETFEQALINAYLAGVNQARADEAAHQEHERRRNRQGYAAGGAGDPVG